MTTIEGKKYAYDSVYSWLAVVFFTQTNVMNRPIFIAVKVTRECKYWLDTEDYDVLEAYSYNMSPRDKRAIRKIIFDHFDYIISEWKRVQEMRNG